MEERNEIEAYDKIHNIRPKFVQALKDAFPDYSLTFSIGMRSKKKVEGEKNVLGERII